MSGGPGAEAERYEKTADFRWTERAFTLFEDEAIHAELREPSPGVCVARVWGPCPRCGHDLDDRQTLSAVTGAIGRRGVGGDAARAAVEPIDVECGCGIAHDGAPADTTGCGVTFRVEFEARPADP